MQTSPATDEVAVLYEQHRAGLRRWAIALTGSPELADELVQEAFAELKQRISSVEQPEAYLNQTLLNLARRAIRRRSRTLVAVPGDVAQEPAVDFDVDTWRALQQLPGTQRVVTVLRYRDDLSIAEIANRIGRSEATVKSLLHRSLRSLRKELS
jgi:RNA polymerase sigma factor (sigma-70 family)